MTISDDSCVRFLSVSNTSSGSAALHRDALHDARAVAHMREHNLARLAQVVEPAGDLDRLAGVPAGVGDRDSRMAHLLRSSSSIEHSIAPASSGLRHLRDFPQFQQQRILAGRGAQQLHGPLPVDGAAVSASSGNRCLSSLPSLSCTCVERMRSFMTSNSASTPRAHVRVADIEDKVQIQMRHAQKVHAAARRSKARWEYFPAASRRRAAARTASILRARRTPHPLCARRTPRRATPRCWIR